MLEKTIQQKIKKELEKQGWVVLRPVSISKSGYPDLWAIKAGLLVFIEVKRPGEVPTPLQEQRHKELKEQGFNVIVAHSVNSIDAVNACIRPQL